MRRNKHEEVEIVEQENDLVPVSFTPNLCLIDGKDSRMSPKIVSLVSREVTEPENYKIPDLSPGEYRETLKLINKIFDDAATRGEQVGPIHYASDLRYYSCRKYIDVAMNNLYKWVMKDFNSIVYEALINIKPSDVPIPPNAFNNTLDGMFDIHKTDSYLSNLFDQLLCLNITEDQRRLTESAIGQRVTMLITEYLQKVIIKLYLTSYMETLNISHARKAGSDEPTISYKSASEDMFRASNMLQNILFNYMESDIYRDELNYEISLIRHVIDQFKEMRDDIVDMSAEMKER